MFIQGTRVDVINDVMNRVDRGGDVVARDTDAVRYLVHAIERSRVRADHRVDGDIGIVTIEATSLAGHDPPGREHGRERQHAVELGQHIDRHVDHLAVVEEDTV